MKLLGGKVPALRLTSGTIKNPVPKLQSIHIAKAKNGFNVGHQFQHGVPTKQFVFHNPASMAQHVQRVVHQNWLKPNVDRQAARITRDLNVNL